MARAFGNKFWCGLRLEVLASLQHSTRPSGGNLMLEQFDPISYGSEKL